MHIFFESDMDSYEIENDDDEVIFRHRFPAGMVFDRLTKYQARALGLVLIKVSKEEN